MIRASAPLSHNSPHKTIQNSAPNGQRFFCARSQRLVCNFFTCKTSQFSFRIVSLLLAAFWLCSCDPESSNSKTTPPRFTLTQKADGTYTLAIGEGVTTITRGEFSADENITGTTKPTTVPTKLKGKLGPTPSRAVTTIVLPSTLLAIDDLAFYNHQMVRALTIPKQVQSIGENAFQYLGKSNPGSNTDLRFEKGSQLKTIQAMAFSDAVINRLILPEQLETIGKAAFQLVRLKDTSAFTIPAKVKTIETGAFVRISLLRATLTIASSDVTLGEKLFALLPTDDLFTAVKLPRAVYDRYTAAELLNRFGRDGEYQDLNGNRY